MGREVRRVPPNWEPRKMPNGRYQPMFDEPFDPKDKGHREIGREYFRPDWPEERRTHYRLYETVTEGTPMSPPFATLEELARWYADHGDPVYGHIDYPDALRFVRAGWAPSGAIIEGDYVHGVKLSAELEGSLERMDMVEPNPE